ncbi:CD1375 family protein [Paenibacillus macquariensis]|nr:CD1375 family protein [Paenibacillus macquariensis]MEC0092899.1 CD1375 family protein [Paenibacillus macquariensis]
MTFTVNSSIVKSYALLILAEKYTIDEVPNVGNLRVTVIEILTT